MSSHTKATIVSLAFISFGKLVLFLGLDIGAVYRRSRLESMNYTNTVNEIYNAMNETHNAYRIPAILLSFDSTALFFTSTLIVITCVIPCFKCCKCVQKLWRNTPFENFRYYCLSLTVIPLIFSGLSHAPYIIIAYVSDADYAGSIFVYYMVILFLEFGLVQYTFRIHFNKPKGKSSCTAKLCTVTIIIIAIVFSLSINFLMMGIFIYFLYVPIKYALSNAPDQVVVVYNSAVLLVGAYITYKAIFYKEDNGGQQNKQDVNNIDAKMKEIATLEHEIAYLQCIIIDKGGKDQNDNQDKIAILWKKICHLRVEMQLHSLHSRFNSILDSLLSQDKKEKMISELYAQQCKLLRYLLAEITGDTVLDHQKKENVRLQGEILEHIQNVLAQFWKEPHLSRAKEQYSDNVVMHIVQIINDDKLENLPGDLRLNRICLVDVHVIFQIEQLNLTLIRQPPQCPPQPPPQAPTQEQFKDYLASAQEQEAGGGEEEEDSVMYECSNYLCV